MNLHLSPATLNLSLQYFEQKFQEIESDLTKNKIEGLINEISTLRNEKVLDIKGVTKTGRDVEKSLELPPEEIKYFKELSNNLFQTIKELNDFVVQLEALKKRLE